MIDTEESGGSGTFGLVDGGGHSASGLLDARRRAAAAIRDLIPIVAFAEPAEDELEAAATELEATAARLAPFATASRHHRSGGMQTLSGDQPEIWEGHPIVGASSAIAAPLVLEELDSTIRATATFSTAYEGAPGVVQGGFIATAFDYVLGRQAALTGLMVVTGTLTVRFRAPAAVGREVAFTTALVSIEGRKVNVAAEARSDGNLVAEAEAIFIAVKQEHYRYEGSDPA
jgi:acyl-coenzyme A thioesterase PaaI-like protein